MTCLVHDIHDKLTESELINLKQCRYLSNGLPCDLKLFGFARMHEAGLAEHETQIFAQHVKDCSNPFCQKLADRNEVTTFDLYLFTIQSCVGLSDFFDPESNSAWLKQLNQENN